MVYLTVDIQWDAAPGKEPTSDQLASISGTEQKLYKCNECEEINEECEEEKLYECNECGTKFPQSEGGGRNGNMCPECRNKFGTKVADSFCSACREGEVEEIDGVVCECGESFDASEWSDHVAREHLANGF